LKQPALAVALWLYRFESRGLYSCCDAFSAERLFAILAAFRGATGERVQKAGSRSSNAWWPALAGGPRKLRYFGRRSLCGRIKGLGGLPSRNPVTFADGRAPFAESIVVISHASEDL